MIFQDSRFGTHNTNLAACLGGLRIPIKNSDPVSVVEEADTGKRVITWFFEMGNDQHKSRMLEKYWRTREAFEVEQPNHPMIPMRRALEKLEWLQLLWFGKLNPAFRSNSREFYTADMNLAACFMASGIDLIYFEKPRFYFPHSAVSFQAAYDRFQEPAMRDNPVALMRRALECRKLLVKLLKHPDLKRLIHYTHGDPLDGGKEAYIVEGTPAETIDLLLNKLYA